MQFFDWMHKDFFPFKEPDYSIIRLGLSILSNRYTGQTFYKPSIGSTTYKLFNVPLNNIFICVTNPGTDVVIAETGIMIFISAICITKQYK